MKVLRLADGRHVARWRDPIGGASRQEGLDKLGLTSDAARRAWAAEKAQQLAALRRAVSLGTVAVARRTPAEAMADYLDGVAHAATRASKRVAVQEFVDWLAASGVRSLADVSGPRLMAWRDALLKPGNGGRMVSTRNRYQAAVRAFLRWCSKRGLVPLLGGDAIRHGCEHAAEPPREIEFLRPPEARRVLLAAIEHDARPSAPRKAARMVLLLLLSGMRIAEAVDLDWSEVAVDAGEIRVPAARTKGKRARAVSFKEAPTLGLLLSTMREEAGRPARGRVFPELSGATWQAAQMRMVARHGAPGFTAHTLRRTCGTVLTNAPSIYGAASAWASARRLGHNVTIAEKHYLGHLGDIPPEARCIEDALGVRDVAEAIARGEAAR
ncbi:MAG: tyrosine-type recombinase/integrase [Planctomycetota bacterium]